MKRYRSQFSGKGHPELILGTTVASKQSNSFNHFSTASPLAYLIDSLSVSSHNNLPLGAEDSLPPSFFAASKLATLFSLNCRISFSDNERPVPSYLKRHQGIKPSMQVVYFLKQTKPSSYFISK